MRTTLKQIADAANVSVTIVSQVLNNKECRVSPEKRKLICETASRMNYRPNQLAVSLKRGTTNTIGLAISDIRNDFFACLAKGLEEECQKNNWNVILCNSNDSHEMDMKNLRMLTDMGVSGIVFGMASESTAQMAEECVDLLIREHTPYLLLDRYIDTHTGGIISVDHAQGGFLAADYLLGKGHRHIACITGPSWLVDSQQRLSGVRKAFEKYGCQLDQRVITEGKYTYESGAEGMKKLLSSGLPIDAVFAFNDMMAIGAIQYLRENGYRVPEDISVMGYDDIFMDRFMETPLTTIRQPAEQMGRSAARQLIGGNIEYQNNQERIIFQPELIERGTVAERCDLQGSTDL